MRINMIARYRAPEIRHERADRRQYRFCNPVEELALPPRTGFTCVHDIEGNQPGQDGRGDQEPHVIDQNDQDNFEMARMTELTRGSGRGFDFLLNIGSILANKGSSGQLARKTAISPFLT